MNYRDPNIVSTILSVSVFLIFLSIVDGESITLDTFLIKDSGTSDISLGTDSTRIFVGNYDGTISIFEGSNHVKEKEIKLIDLFSEIEPGTINLEMKKINHPFPVDDRVNEEAKINNIQIRDIEFNSEIKTLYINAKINFEDQRGGFSDDFLIIIPDFSSNTSNYEFQFFPIPRIHSLLENPDNNQTYIVFRSKDLESGTDRTMELQLVPLSVELNSVESILWDKGITLEVSTSTWDLVFVKNNIIYELDFHAFGTNNSIYKIDLKNLEKTKINVDDIGDISRFTFDVDENTLYGITEDFPSLLWGQIIKFELDGTLIEKKEIGLDPREIAISATSDTIITYNQGLNSISEISTKDFKLKSNNFESFRFEIGALVVLIIGSVSSFLILTHEPKIPRKLIFGSIVCIGGFFSLWGIQQLFPNLTGELVSSLFLLLGLLFAFTFSCIFVIFIILKKKFIQTTFLRTIYDFEKELLIKGITFDLKKIKSTSKFILISWIIGILMIFLAFNLSIESFLSFIPGLDNVSDLIVQLEITENIPENSDEKTFLTFTSENLKYSEYIIFPALGGLWIFILRQFWKTESAENQKKYRGSRSLLIFIYFSFILLLFTIIPQFFEILQSRKLDNYLTILLIYSVFSVIASIFLYCVERYFVFKIWPKEVKKWKKS